MIHSRIKSEELLKLDMLIEIPRIKEIKKYIKQNKTLYSNIKELIFLKLILEVKGESLIENSPESL